MVEYILGIFTGMLLFGLVNSVLQWKKYSLFLKKRKLKVGQIYGSYHYNHIESWMKEDYTELFKIISIGEKYVKVQTIDDKRVSPDIGRITNFDIELLLTKYKKYNGVKDKESIYDDILEFHNG